MECASEHASGEATSTDEVSERLRAVHRLQPCRRARPPRMACPRAKSRPIAEGSARLHQQSHARSGCAAGTRRRLAVSSPNSKRSKVAREFASVSATRRKGTSTKKPQPVTPSGHDGIISPIIPVNQMTHTFTQNYRAKNSSVECRVWPRQTAHGDTNAEQRAAVIRKHSE